MTSTFLVTTSHSVLVVDVGAGTYRAIERGRGLYYGIAIHADSIFIAARGRMVSSELPGSEERGRILVFDRRLAPVAELDPPFALRDMHEIAWHEDKLWVTCSFDNMVAIFDGSHWHRWYPLGEPTSAPYDRNHLNSLFFDEDELCVLAHDWGDSTLHFFDAATLVPRHRISMGNQAHNVWKENSEYLTCSSGAAAIVGTLGFSLDTGGFPRGVGRMHDVRCIGISERVERSERDLTTGILAVYDQDWRPLKRISLDREGLVLDVQPFES